MIRLGGGSLSDESLNDRNDTVSCPVHGSCSASKVAQAGLLTPAVIFWIGGGAKQRYFRSPAKPAWVGDTSTQLDVKSPVRVSTSDHIYSWSAA